ncbi:hypothetical protein F4678DRAFT_431330 [Xylaria arbuscula]|nr:hypothetical protein F4678DRAFT_431330 [Xylaria arbuscula]
MNPSLSARRSQKPTPIKSHRYPLADTKLSAKRPGRSRIQRYRRGEDQNASHSGDEQDRAPIEQGQDEDTTSVDDSDTGDEEEEAPSPRPIGNPDGSESGNLGLKDGRVPTPPPPSTSVRQKHSTQITISDDRSRGSEFERTGRIYWALTRTNRQPQLAPSLLNPQPSILDYRHSPNPSEFQPSASNRQFDPPYGSGLTAPGGSNHKLQDYQMQLMLLEQQNKKRLMTARLEQDSYGHMNTSRAHPVVSTMSMPNSSPGLKPMGLLYVPKVGQNGRSSGPRPIEASTLGIPEESAISLETLRAYISDLQEKVKGIEGNSQPKRPSMFQTIHRIAHGNTSRMYFDEPQWIAGESNSKEALVSNLPLSNLPSYLAKHPEIVFVVYRDYDLPTMKNTPANDEGDTVPRANHTSEILEPTSEDLTIAVANFLECHKGFEEVVDGAEPIRLSAPYLAIYHTREAMEAFLGSLVGQQRHQFDLLLDYVHGQYGKEYEIVDDLIKRGKITHPYIKYLIKPGDVLVAGKHQDARGYLCKSWGDEVAPPFRKKSSKGSSAMKRYEFAAWHWTFDGVFSRKITTLKLCVDINDDSEKCIDELSLRPLVHLNKDMDRMLQRRGKLFWKCRVRHFVSYHEDTNRESHHSGDDRYMIDLKMYRKLHKQETKQNTYVGQPDTDDLGSEAMDQDELPDEKFGYLLPPLIKGYNLKKKKWLDLRVDRISEVIWNKEAFESLVLDRKTKRLIQALISNQLEAEKATDLISGKGNGLILLLHGGPGTGKTLTAESVAEIAEKPLYPVTCGDIGTEPEEVEHYLESVLHLGKTWGCVVLLDEADVFLEQRKLEDLQRNSLVSVFLRVLEYYDGILILTSNRVGTFDEAFKSRIQLALHYADLTSFQRIQIWGNFIRRLEKLEEKGIDFDDLRDHIEQLAKNKINGREIRNAITTARQYAKWENQLLDYKLLEGIIETAGRFDRYIEKLNGGYSQDQLAEDEGVRLARDLPAPRSETDV